MIRAIIVDDEPKNRKILRSLLTDFCPQVTITGEAASAEEARTLIDEETPDLLFLDIEMPRGNAFDLLDEIMPVKFEIIFITAFDEYTLKAFRYSALDYLLKPVDPRVCNGKLLIAPDGDWESFCNKVVSASRLRADIPPAFFQNFDWTASVERLEKLL